MGAELSELVVTVMVPVQVLPSMTGLSKLTVRSAPLNAFNAGLLVFAPPSLYFSVGISMVSPASHSSGSVTSSAVEELTALWAAWESAYRAPDEGEGFSDAALWWHEKLHAVVHRLWDEQFAECKAGYQDPDVYERVTDPSFDEFLQGR